MGYRWRLGPARRPCPRCCRAERLFHAARGGAKKRAMSVPDTIVVKRDLELRGRRHELGVRRALFGLLPLISLLALVNLFGQRPSRSDASAVKASLAVYAPSRVRGGLLYQARFHVTARADVKKAVLVLDAGWLENITVNSIEPQPVSESSADGRLALDLGHLPSGESYLLFIYFQVNPTNIGHRTANVTLYDGSQKLLEVSRTITIFP
jgi:hypothetical protein